MYSSIEVLKTTEKKLQYDKLNIVGDIVLYANKKLREINLLKFKKME